MDFSNMIKKGTVKKAPRLMMIGVEGVGKSSAGADLPSPIFLCAESGLVGPQFADSAHITPKDWEESLAFLDWLAMGQHDYKSLVVDTLDWLEKLLFAIVVRNAKKQDIKSITDFDYGKGYEIAAFEFRQFIARLDKLNDNGMTVLLLAHSQIKTFNNPIGENYDRYEAKCCKQIAGLAKEWCDAVLFAFFDVYTKKDGGKAKGNGGQVRVVKTEHSAGWDAKNRYGLPETMPLDMQLIMSEIDKGQPQNETEMRQELLDIMPELPADKQASLREWINKKKYTSSQLAQTLNRARAQVESNKGQ